MKSVLFVGYKGKRSHVQSARKKYRLFLLIEKGDYHADYESEFERVFVVEDIFDWKCIHLVLEGQLFHAVLTRYEEFVVQVSAIADYFELPGIALEQVLNFRNKYLMRKVLHSQHVPSAAFKLLSQPEEATDFVKKHSFPLILKQLSGIHSKYVTKVETEEELEKMMTHYLQALQNEADPLRQRLSHSGLKIDVPHPHEHLLLEEMLQGQELSVDAFVLRGQVYFLPLCRYVLAKELGIEDHQLPVRYLPYKLEQPQEALIYEVVEKALHALGADFCTIHAEVFFDPFTNDCRLLEVAARGGGFRAEMYGLSLGIDYDLMAVEAALGITPVIPKSFDQLVAVVEVFADKEGVLEFIDTQLLEKREDIFHLTQNKHVGDEVGRAICGKSYILKFQMVGATMAQLKRDALDLLKQLRQSIVVR